MGFSIFRTTMTFLICCFLIMLFLLPSAVLTQFSKDVNELIDAAETALLTDDLETAEQHCNVLNTLMREQMPVLERFLNHSNIDALDARFEIAAFSIRIGDSGTAAEALAEARSVLKRIEGIELFSWNNLL